MGKMMLIAVAALSIASTAHASGRTDCPDAEAPNSFEEKNQGVWLRGSTDKEGWVDAPGATQCTIVFMDRHKTTPRCRTFGAGRKVLRTSRTEAVFAFDPPLGSNDSDPAFAYHCRFR
jgi:hypothetical protein